MVRLTRVSCPLGSADEGMAIQVEIGRMVRLHRTRLGWTQARLAEAAGISEQALSKIERGQTAAIVPTLEALAGALGIEVRDLFPPPAAGDDRAAAIARIVAHLETVELADFAHVEAAITAMLRLRR